MKLLHTLDNTICDDSSNGKESAEGLVKEGNSNREKTHGEKFLKKCFRIVLIVSYSLFQTFSILFWQLR